ncbi:MAG: universal stress protein UspA [Cyclobacteriaceae bacterium]|nr:MAG: universal stress protein UspA [Cyclobacteriaceae bacterium]
MKYILVPINFDDKGAAVISYSVSLAQELNLELKLLHVLAMEGVPAPIDAHAGSISYNGPLGEHLNARLERAENKMKALAKRVNSESNINCEFTIKTGFVDIQVLEQSESEDIAMVVMGTPQHHNLLNQLLGSRSLKILNHSEIPVLLIPNNTSYFPIKHIVVGASYENPKDIEASWLIRMACKLKARLHFIRVTKEINSEEQLMFTGYKEQLTKLLSNHVACSFKLVEEESIDDGLTSYRQINQADLIALQRSTKSGWDHLLSENVSKEMALGTSVPLLIY